MATENVYALSSLREKHVITVGISDMKISDDPGTSLITYALGSCIAVVMYDAKLRLGGMLHYLLPDSAESHDKPRSPLCFCDSGLEILFNQVMTMGAVKPRLIIKAVGGAAVLKNNIDIGARNYRALQNFLKRNRLRLYSQDVGGGTSRTAIFELDTGLVTVRKKRKLTYL